MPKLSWHGCIAFLLWFVLLNRPFATVLVLFAGKVCHAISLFDGTTLITEALEYRETYSREQGYSCSLAEKIGQSRGFYETTCFGGFGLDAAKFAQLGPEHQP